jgi:O-antigen ligase
MTFEPKWFAEQLSFLLLPWLLASVIQGKSVFRWRYRWVTIEWLILIWSVVILFFTFSRTGYGILVIAIFLAIILSRLMRQDRTRAPRKSILSRNVILPALVAALAMIAIIGIVGAQNRYFSRLWSYWITDRPKNRTFLEYIGAGQRLVYLETALRMYEDYPIFGVGLGNYAFYFDEFLPERPYNRQPEIIRQITPVEGRVRLITSKNLFARLVAETGLVGTVVFSTFIIAIIGCTLYLLISKSPAKRYWGISGLLGIVIFLVLVFSFDSFAIPNMWVVFGLITAAAHLPSESDAL